ncbi:MAG: radical SAM protein [Candidatus Margulisbacteria bacterium]|nr:radical SAM protein [Candidatus Margulisiibacteriota bacterium]MBU1022621.1 radical SAM protein [Candidatus Margulisiibacteriota bacterium]MBU1729442.1 radical SAM protein [Candidatus Margulisiibacteriota bacterium]MBU1955457.1 radical SAM protein [Candidatus Margulisiibacteriota bacterium]
MQNLLDKILPKVSKPARYVGGEINSVKKDWDKVPLKILLSYPDAYEIGMSNLGIQILYDLINQKEDALAERTFAPWPDMEAEMRQNQLPLFSLENQRPAKDFDLWGFSMQHELTYTNFLNMLDLAGLKLRAKDRAESDPIIFAGGPGTLNPAPLAPFFDFILVGDAEDAILEIIEVYKSNKDKSKSEKLAALAKIEGVYVPGLTKSVKMRKVTDLNQTFCPTKPLVPNIDVVHGRAVLEIMRGCKRGCRFCMAGYTLKPVRERSPENLLNYAKTLIDNTGYQELSLVSLSSSDYSKIEELAKKLADELKKKKINIALPSLRLNNFTINLIQDILKVRSKNLTVAPEAGTQRLRDVIRKDLSEAEILEGAKIAFAAGINSLKLYFMLGLPTETEEDVKAICELSQKILKIGREVNKRTKVTVNLSTFVPKPHTPFQWEKQITLEETLVKQNLIKHTLKKGKGIDLRWHQAELSYLEGLLARGDEQSADLIEAAWKAGARFDAWGDQFKYEPWQKAIETSGIKPIDYLRERKPDEKLPWDFINVGISRDLLIREREKAHSCKK